MASVSCALNTQKFCHCIGFVAVCSWWVCQCLCTGDEKKYKQKMLLFVCNVEISYMLHILHEYMWHLY